MLAMYEKSHEYFTANPDGVAAKARSRSIYQPDERLAPLLAEFEAYTRVAKPKKKELQRAGVLLEQIAFIVFDCVRGRGPIKSYPSAGPQHDLLVTGNEVGWESFVSYVRLDPSKRGVLVECKATKDPVGDPTFARLCAVLHHNFDTQGGLGVFFTISGASGFPRPGTPRQKHLTNARLRQVLFYARCRTPIVVLDRDDILTLGARGSLVELLESRIRDIEELSGVPVDPGPTSEIDLPAHLASLLRPKPPA